MVLALASAGCDGFEAPVDTGPVDTGWFYGCGGQAPSLGGARAVGMIDPDTAEPTVMVQLLPTDADGALHRYQVEVWHDVTLDRIVDSSRPPDVTFDLDPASGEYISSVTPCDHNGGYPVLLNYRAAEYGLPPDTHFELAVQIIDADGWRSDRPMASGCTATADGQPGCGATSF